MERGFYHPSRGYWQTTGDVPPSILAAYPQGTVEVPLKPDANAVWDGQEWQAGEPTPPTVEDYREAVQAHVDAVAQARDYRHGDALAGHVNDPKPEWAAEAAAFVAWRSAVWQQVHALWASPPDPVPSPEEVVAGLPVIEWPEVG